MANIIQVIKEFDPEVDAGYSFPSTTDYVRMSGPNYAWLEMHGSGAPSTDHDNAPLGSRYLDYDSDDWYRHTATSTWTLLSSA